MKPTQRESDLVHHGLGVKYEDAHPYSEEFAELFFVGYGEEWSDCYLCYLETRRKNHPFEEKNDSLVYAVDRTLWDMSQHPDSSITAALTDTLAPWYKPEFDISNEL